MRTRSAMHCCDPLARTAHICWSCTSATARSRMKASPKCSVAAPVKLPGYQDLP